MSLAIKNKMYWEAFVVAQKRGHLDQNASAAKTSGLTTTTVPIRPLYNLDTEADL